MCSRDRDGERTGRDSSAATIFAVLKHHNLRRRPAQLRACPLIDLGIRFSTRHVLGRQHKLKSPLQVKTAENIGDKRQPTTGRDAARYLSRFECVEGKSHGFIRVSEKDKFCLEFDDGTFYYPIGHNISAVFDARAKPLQVNIPAEEGTYAYDRMLKRMREVTREKLIATFPIFWTYRMPIRKVRLTLRRCPVYFYTRAKTVERCEALFDRVRIDRLGKIYLAVGEIVQQ